MNTKYSWLIAFCFLCHCPIFCYEIKGEKNAVATIAREIKILALDVDGVLTNGDIAYSSNGDEIKTFNVKDGLGLVRASQNGIVTAFITGRESSIVERRGKELKVQHIYQNVKDKKAVLEELASLHHVKLQEICYIGDDLPDLSVSQLVGLACCPSDAVLEVRQACSWISSYEGGKGAVRELTDFLITANN